MKKNKGMWTAAQISKKVLYVLIGITAVLFVAFFCFGYDMPYSDNPSFNAPLLTNVLLMYVGVLFMISVGVGVWMVVRSLKNHNKDDYIVNGIPVSRNACVLTVITVLLLILTFILGSSSTIQINGKPFSDVFWLKVADMFVWSSIILMLSAVGIVIYSYGNNQRKETA